jgi:hypothetical protein
MVNPNVTRGRAVLVTGQAPPVRPAAFNGAGGSTTGQVRTVSHATRVREMLKAMLVGRAAHLNVPGAERPFDVILDLLQPPPGRSMEPPIAARGEAAFAAVEWRRGMTVAAWFPQPTGVYGFKTQVLGYGSDRLLLEGPGSLIRYSRRAAPRYAVREDDPPTVLVPLADRTWFECREVLDLSIGGLSLTLPADIAFAAGKVTTLALRLLRQDHPLTLSAACRHARPLADGRMRYGLQFLDGTRLTALTIERYVQKMGLRSLEDDTPVVPPPLALTPETAPAPGPRIDLGSGW